MQRRSQHLWACGRRDEQQVGFMSTLTWRTSERVMVDGGVNTQRQDNR
jgi:hypothetical protein